MDLRNSVKGVVSNTAPAIGSIKLADRPVTRRWIRINSCMRSFEFESQSPTPKPTFAATATPSAPTAEQSRINTLKRQKDTASMALAAERKRQTIAKAQKQIATAQLTQ